MMSQPIISLIIPIYNVGKFLPQTLSSVQNQTFKNFEAVCINDGSFDNSLDIINEFAKSDKRFKLIDKKNEGVSAARNDGVKAAQGKYIMFLDGDDYLHPQAMEIALDGITRSGADVCRFGYHEVSADEKVEYSSIFKEEKISIINKPALIYLKKSPIYEIYIWNKIYNSEVVRDISFYPIHPGEDDLYTLQVLLNIRKYAAIEAHLVYYVQHAQSVMHVIKGEQWINNRRIVKREFFRILKNFMAEHPKSYVKETALRYQIDYNRKMIKDLFIIPIRQGADNARILQNYNLFKQMLDDGDCSLFAVKFKHKIVIKLLAKQHLKLARLLLFI